MWNFIHWRKADSALGLNKQAVSVWASVHATEWKVNHKWARLCVSSQNMGHAQHVSLYLCPVEAIFIVCVLCYKEYCSTFLPVCVCVYLVSTRTVWKSPISVQSVPAAISRCFLGFLVWLKLLWCVSIQGFEPEWLYTGENFGKVLNTLLAVNFATQGKHFLCPKKRN